MRRRQNAMTILIAGTAFSTLALTGCSGDVAITHTSAEVMCQEFVEKELGTGIEQSGPGEAEDATETAENEWTYDGWARPATGQQVDYTCVVSHDGDETWTLEDLTER